MKEGKSVYVMKRVIWCAAKFSLFKTKQKTPRFDAPKAYQDALPVNSKKYDGDTKMAQKFVLSVPMKWYNVLVTTHSSLS